MADTTTEPDVYAVSVLIPSWNGRNHLEATLPTVLSACSAAPCKTEIWVGDDGSSDGTSEWLRDHWPQIKVSRSDANLGFSSTLNRLSRVARGRLIYFLNNDAKPASGFLDPLLHYFEDPRVFAVGSMEVSHSLTGRLSYPRMWPKLGLHYSRYDEIPLPIRGGFPVCFVSAGHCCLRRALFLELGGFDERFNRIYMEDHDLCLRARSRGWKILLEPASQVVHPGQATMAKHFAKRELLALHWRNRFLLTWARYRRRLDILGRLIGLPALLAVSLLRGRMEVLAAYAQARTRRRSLPPPPRGPHPPAARKIPRFPLEQPVRVLILHQHAIIGGAEHSIELWLRHMPPWLKPTVVLGERGPLADRLAAGGFDVRFTGLPAFRPSGIHRVAAAVVRLARLARAERFALIHSHTPRSNLYAALVGRLTGIPVAWHARNLIYGPMRDIERELSFLPNRILCISHAVEQRFQKDGTLPPRVETIHHGIDTEAFSPDVSGARFRADLGLSPNDLAVGIVGRIGVGKGHPLFIQAATLALGRGSRARFVIVGGAQSPEEIEIERDARLQVSRGAFGDRFIFAGMRSDIPCVMAGLDVLALCTEAEPLGRVILEAMATGKPVVASNAGGVPELIERDVSGLLYPPGDAEALAAALLRLEKDPGLRKRLGWAARQRACEEFSVERHVRRMAQIYWETVTSS